MGNPDFRADAKAPAFRGRFIRGALAPLAALLDTEMVSDGEQEEKDQKQRE